MDLDVTEVVDLTVPIDILPVKVNDDEARWVRVRIESGSYGFAEEVTWVTRAAGVSEHDLVPHDSGDTITVGDLVIELVHTPGHTPGSQCFLVAGKLVSGDTLFLDGCGRTDLPGSDPASMVESLKRLSRVDDAVILYPGHRYSLASSATMAAVKQSNYVFESLA